LRIIGVRSTLILSIRVAKGKGGLNDFWYSSMRKPPFAFSYSDWKLMLI